MVPTTETVTTRSLAGVERRSAVLIELTDEAQQLVRRKGDTLTVDYIRSTG